MADDTSKQYPLHTLWKAVWRPAILAAVELSRNQPGQAIELLQPASAYERAYELAIYFRGLAYLRLRKGEESAAEFQRILDHKGANWGTYYALSYVGLGRAAVLAGDIPRARKAYQEHHAAASRSTIFEGARKLRENRELAHPRLARLTQAA